MSNYVKTCSFCKHEIKVSDESGKWLPYNKDGSQHDCRKKNGEDVTVETLVRKLESLGFIVNVVFLFSHALFHSRYIMGFLYLNPISYHTSYSSLLFSTGFKFRSVYRILSLYVI